LEYRKRDVPGEWHSGITKTKVDMRRGLDGNLLSGIRIATKWDGKKAEGRESGILEG